MESKTITVRLTLDLLERVAEATDNRNAFIVEAIEEKLSPVKATEVELTDTEKRGVLKGAKNLNDVLQDLILQEAERRKNFLVHMDDETFAKLVASRLPKELQNDLGQEAEVLSLRESLATLPGIPDLTAELNKVKGLLFRAERERDLNLKLLNVSKGKAELSEFVGLLYRSVVEYVADLIARRSFPGFGDGGGLTDKAYSDIADEVARLLSDLKLPGVKNC